MPILYSTPPCPASSNHRFSRTISWRVSASRFTYLLFPEFDIQFIDFEDCLQVESHKRQLYPFLDYCIHYSALHARLALTEPPSVAQLFSSKSRIIENWLLSAAQHASPQAEVTVEWLVERGACIDVTDSILRSPLHHAVRNNCKGSVLFLLRRGAKITLDKYNMTPLHYTVSHNAQEVAQIFFNAGIPVDLPVSRKAHRPAFGQDEVIYPKPTVVQTAVQRGPPEQGLTPLHLATLTGSLKMTGFLLNHGANPNFPSIHHETPLHLALKEHLYGSKPTANSTFQDCWNDPDYRIECILDYPDEDEYESSCAYIYDTRLTIVNLLLEHPHIDVNAQDIFGRSPLHIAAHSKFFTAIVQNLIDKGAGISTGTKNGEMPLHIACKKGNVDTAHILLTSGADPIQSDDSGVNALHYAAKYGDLELLKDVLNHVPSNSLDTFVNSRDNQGRNALHYLLMAKRFVNTDVLRFLPKASTRVNALDHAGMSPMARFFGRFVLMGSKNDPEILRLMFLYGADASFSTRGGLNMAHLAAQSRRVSTTVLQTLAQAGVDMRARDKQGRTALHHSAISGTLTKEALSCLRDEFLLSPWLVDVSGKTALDYAVEKNEKEHHPDMFDRTRWARAETLLQE